ncbi:hypothetical protein L211DRAFT_517140 [Terfezia boudieri ATCC MYA-4762]|uniref:Uncharacterized protein n=1 Tax=Terfezia boudieri ATCC MYA-4762 TaxID=1051890 RepID=A0A3N4LCF1_9PEZI|nr:hypothetical protein L211DRAFT_517140 [Terfezia boudieri ATCC MYA-4762]
MSVNSPNLWPNDRCLAGPAGPISYALRYTGCVYLSLLRCPALHGPPINHSHHVVVVVACFNECVRSNSFTFFFFLLFLFLSAGSIRLFTLCGAACLESRKPSQKGSKLLHMVPRLLSSSLIAPFSPQPLSPTSHLPPPIPISPHPHLLPSHLEPVAGCIKSKHPSCWGRTSPCQLAGFATVRGRLL